MYRQVNGGGVTFASSLVELGPGGAGLLDGVMGGAETVTKSGYKFGLTGDADSFEATAVPVNPGVTGIRYFFMNVPGVIRFNPAGPAGETDPPV
jgi:hypothetical protein